MVPHPGHGPEPSTSPRKFFVAIHERRAASALYMMPRSGRLAPGAVKACIVVAVGMHLPVRARRRHFPRKVQEVPRRRHGVVVAVQREDLGGDLLLPAEIRRRKEAHRPSLSLRQFRSPLT